MNGNIIRTDTLGQAQYQNGLAKGPIAWNQDKFRPLVP